MCVKILSTNELCSQLYLWPKILDYLTCHSSPGQGWAHVQGVEEPDMAENAHPDGDVDENLINSHSFLFFLFLLERNLWFLFLLRGWESPLTLIFFFFHLHGFVMSCLRLRHNAQLNPEVIHIWVLSLEEQKRNPSLFSEMCFADTFVQKSRCTISGQT